MGKKSLKKRIDDLVNSLGMAEKPAPLDIRNVLVPIGIEVEALEDGQALSEKDTRIADLEGELRDLQITLQTASDQLETFRAEQKEREEKQREIAPIQLKILRSLPTQYDGHRGPGIAEIAHTAGGPIDEAAIYIEGLEALGLARRQQYNDGSVSWLRTTTGNQLVVAKRWAGEEEKEETAQESRSAELSMPESVALVKMARAPDGITPSELAQTLQFKTTATALFILVLLREKGLAADRSAQHFTLERRWFILPKGAQWLSEHSMLPK